MINKTIANRYTFEKQLGEGSFGKVYYAYDMKLCKYWAIKVSPSSASLEADALKKIDNYSFPRIVDYISDESYNYLVMDYIEGTPLDKYISTHILSEKEILTFTISIAKALDYLHHMTPPMIYMDCKPSNIIVTPQKDIRLVDMGSIYLCDMPVQKKSGTNGYAPFEITVSGNESLLGPATDIYCLGKTMYRMLTQSNKEYRDRDGNLSIRCRNKKVSRRTEMIVRKCTCPDIKKRYQSMTELIRDIEESKKQHAVNISYVSKLLSTSSIWAVSDAILKGVLAAAILYCAYNYNQLGLSVFLILFYLMTALFILLLRTKRFTVSETKTDLFKTAGPRIITSIIICTLCSSTLSTGVSASNVTPSSEIIVDSSTEAVDKLPVTLYDEYERKLLLSRGTCWETCDDIKLSIPIEELGDDVNTITITCSTKDSTKCYSFEVAVSDYVNQ